MMIFYRADSRNLGAVKIIGFKPWMELPIHDAREFIGSLMVGDKKGRAKMIVPSFSGCNLFDLST